MSVAALVLAAAVFGGAGTNGVAGAAGASGGVSTNRPPARITSDSTYYDRKEGLAIFKGRVHVDDVDYQLHANRAYVFMDVASNSLSRIAATGAVALTNGARRAYGEKLTYRRDDGLVVLHGSETDASRPALVIEDTPEGPRTAKGRRIRFWINAEQVEVVDAVLTAPQGGKGGAMPFEIPGAGGK